MCRGIGKLLQLSILRLELTGILKNPVVAELSFRQIARYFGKTQDAALFIVQGCYDDAYPKLGSIFSNAPTFITGPSLRSCFSQEPLRQSDLLILWKVKDAKMLPYDLLLGISFDPLGAPIPTLYDAFRV